jgi:hypothetical protein
VLNTRNEGLQPDTMLTSRHRTRRSAAAPVSTLGMSSSTTTPPWRGRGPWPRSSGRWTSPRTGSRYRGVCPPNPFHPPARRDPQAAMDLRSRCRFLFFLSILSSLFIEFTLSCIRSSNQIFISCLRPAIDWCACSSHMGGTLRSCSTAHLAGATPAPSYGTSPPSLS